MPFGYPPYTRNADDAVESRVLAKLENKQPGQPSYLRRVLARLWTREGLQALGSGLGAASQASGPLAAFAAGLSGTTGAMTAQEAKRAAGVLEGRKLGLEERRVAAEERRAAREARATEGTGQKLEAERDFLRSIGFTDDEIKQFYGTRGFRGAGGGGGGRLTDRDKLAQGLLAQGRAKSLDEAYIMAATIGQQPQLVGSVTRQIADPEDPFSFTTRRESVFRRLNQLTGDYELIDSGGNFLTDKDMQTFRSAPAGFAGGTGGEAGVGNVIEEPPPPPPPPPPGPIGDWRRYAPQGAPVTAGLPGMAPAPVAPQPSHGGPAEGLDPEDIARVRASNNPAVLNQLLALPTTPPALKALILQRLGELRG